MAVLKFKNPDTKKWAELKVVQDGISYIPTLSNEGVLTWQNNAGLPNPAPVSLRPTGVLMYNTRGDFPAIKDASADGIYIARDTNALYRFDVTQKEYSPLSADPNNRSLIFVTALPTAENAETGIVYALRKDDGSFELWGKNDGQMIMIDGSDTEIGAPEIITAESYHDFPAVGDPSKIYVSSSINMTYRFDETLGKYVTVGDKLMSVEAGNESDAEADILTADDVKNIFHS